MPPSDTGEEKNGMDSAAAGKDAAPDAGIKSETLPPPEFSTFIASLAVSVLYSLGEVKDPETGETGKNLVVARHTIDILEMLKQKTAGNLDAGESALLDNTLHDLRMKYVEASKKQ